MSETAKRVKLERTGYCWLFVTDSRFIVASITDNGAFSDKSAAGVSLKGV